MILSLKRHALISYSVVLSISPYLVNFDIVDGNDSYIHSPFIVDLLTFKDFARSKTLFSILEGVKWQTAQADYYGNCVTIVIVIPFLTMGGNEKLTIPVSKLILRINSKGLKIVFLDQKHL